MPAHDRDRCEVNDHHKIALEDSVVLGDHIVLLAVGVVSM